MKRGFYTVLVALQLIVLNEFAISANLSPSDQDPVLMQQRQDGSFDFMMTEIARVHKALYALPYDYEYIRGTLMPEIISMRAQVSPHFPKREDYGEDQEEATRQFKFWYDNFPGEWKAYVAFVDQYVQQHMN